MRSALEKRTLRLYISCSKSGTSSPHFAYFSSLRKIEREMERRRREFRTISQKRQESEREEDMQKAVCERGKGTVGHCGRYGITEHDRL